MNNEQLIVRVDPDGRIHAETKGIKRPDCLSTIALLEALLDAETAHSAFTDDYYQTPVENTLEGRTDELYES